MLFPALALCGCHLHNTGSIDIVKVLVFAPLIFLLNFVWPGLQMNIKKRLKGTKHRKNLMAKAFAVPSSSSKTAFQKDNLGLRENAILKCSKDIC